jgi:hypothetical protein
MTTETGNLYRDIGCISVDGFGLLLEGPAPSERQAAELVHQFHASRDLYLLACRLLSLEHVAEVPVHADVPSASWSIAV